MSGRLLNLFRSGIPLDLKFLVEIHDLYHLFLSFYRDTSRTWEIKPSPCITPQ